MKPFQSQSHEEKEPHLRFVEGVRVRRASKPVRVHWKHFVLAVFWFLILMKCLLAHWAIVFWEMPFGSVYVWAPTVFAAALCTIVFLAGGEENPGD